MNKEVIITNTKKKFSGELLDIVLKQIDNFFELSESKYQVDNNYNIGDSVILNDNHILHGIGSHTDIIKIFSERGIISPDFFGTNINHAFCYTSAFWTVDNNILLKDFIKNYSGIVANYNGNYELVPYGELDNFVEKMRNIDHWLWTAESSMEIRFMPSLARDNNQIGFIINTENKIAKRLRKNSVFKDSFKKEYAFEFINENHKQKFIKDGFTADFFERADYLIFGIPKNCIEGILVGREYEIDNNILDKLKEYFPNSYICNLDGKVIK